MNTITPRQYLEIFVEKCPCHGKSLPTCPLSEFREKRKIITRREYLAGISDEKVDELFRQHLLCVHRVCGV
jgi:hypothetical protein